MNAFTVLSTFSFLALLSCTSPKPKELPQVEIPRPLKQDASYDLLVSKRSYDNMVERLYKDEVEKTPELSALEARIEALSKNKHDSTNAYRDYETNNQLYYSSGNMEISKIQDSVLKNRMKELIAASLKKYTTRIAPQKQLLLSIDQKTTSLNDLHTVLKLTRTLAIMEKYQDSNFPNAKPLENYSKELDATIKETDRLSKKQP